MSQTDEARKYIKKIMKPEYHHYIDVKLAGDFSFEIANVIEDLVQGRDFWRGKCEKMESDAVRVLISRLAESYEKEGKQ